MSERPGKWSRLETINAISTVVMALCAAAMMISTWESYNLAKKALQASEEPLIEVQNVKSQGDGVAYTIRNSGTIRLESIRVSERALTEGILNRTVSVVGPLYVATAHEASSLTPGEVLTLSSKWISLKNIGSPRIEKTSTVGVFELRISFVHEVTKRGYERTFQFLCFPSESGWRIHQRTDPGMEALRTFVSQSLGKK